MKISGNVVQVKYPVSGRTRIAWFARKEFTNYNIANEIAEKCRFDDCGNEKRFVDIDTITGLVSNFHMVDSFCKKIRNH